MGNSPFSGPFDGLYLGKSRSYVGGYIHPATVSALRGLTQAHSHEALAAAR